MRIIVISLSICKIMFERREILNDFYEPLNILSQPTSHNFYVNFEKKKTIFCTTYILFESIQNWNISWVYRHVRLQLCKIRKTSFIQNGDILFDCLFSTFNNMISLCFQVTGANRGIGKGVVRTLCRRYEGYIYLTSRNKTLGEAALKEIRDVCKLYITLLL